MAYLRFIVISLISTCIAKNVTPLSSYKIFHIQKIMSYKYLLFFCPPSGCLSAVPKVFVSLSLVYQKLKYISTNCTTFNALFHRI